VTRRSVGSTLFILALVGGCGARSDLSEEEGGRVENGGSGGQGADGGGGQGAQGGGGSGPGGACAAFAVGTEARSFDSLLDGQFGRDPQLFATTLDGSRVTLAFRSQPEDIPIDDSPLINQVTFSPWDDWPDTILGNARQLSFGQAFTVPRTREDGIHLLLFRATFAGGPELTALVGAPVDEDNPAAVLVSPDSRTPAFVSGPFREAGPTGLGYTYSVTDGEQGELVSLFPEGAVSFLAGGCTSDPIHVDAVRTGGAMLAAITLVAGGPCSPGLGFRVVRYDEDELEVVAEWAASGSLAQLQLVPLHGAEGGEAWVVWQTTDGRTAGPLMGMRVSAEGSLETEPIVLVGEGLVFDRVALSSSGDDRLVVAYRDVLDPGPPNFIVMGFDRDGVNTFVSSYAPVAWPRPRDRYAVFGSPAGDHLLLSWASDGVDPTITGSAQLYTVRFDCE
jgi:hypothetical protein